MRLHHLLFLSVFIFLGSSCSHNHQQLESVHYRIIAQGSYSNISLSQRMLIKTPEQFALLWRTHAPGERITTPVVDFDDEMVIAYFAGQFPSGGYRLEVIQLVETDAGLQVDIKLHRPAKNAIVSLALSQPYIMLATEENDEKIYFNFIK